MKKHVYSLMMVLALVVLAGTSAWAQTGQQDDPYWHVNGSTHTLHVTNNANSSFSWTSSATVGATPADALTAMTTTTNSISITWSEYAVGEYYFDVTEVDNTNACETTTRRIYIDVLDFDVYAYFSDANGADIEGTAAMAACGAGTTVNYGDIGPGTAFSQEVQIEGTGAVGDLTGQIGTNTQTQRYIALAVTFNVPVGVTTFTAPNLASIQFDYSIALTDANSTLDDFNGEGAATSGNTIVNESATANLFVAPLLYDVRWGIVDVTTAFTITNATIFDAADAGGTQLGVELSTNEAANASADPAQNTTDTQTIWSAPATTVIDVD